MMENNLEFQKDKDEKDQNNLNIENLRPISNRSGRNKLIKKSYTIAHNMSSLQLKKSDSLIFPHIEMKEKLNNDQANINNNEFSSTNKSNSVIFSSLFNKDINLTTLNEHSGNNFSYNNKDKNNMNSNEHEHEHDKYHLFKKLNVERKLLSKNFENLMKSNDFSPNLGKYDNKIILLLSQKCKEFENKYLKTLNYYYQMENIYINEEKKKKESQIKLNNCLLEKNMLKNKYQKMMQDNIHLNNALTNTRNEIDRLNNAIKDDQKQMIKQQDEYNKQLKKEEDKRISLNNEIKINERQISILQEKINDSGLSRSMKIKKYLKNGYYNSVEGDDKKDEEIQKLKYTILDLQNQVSNLQKVLKKKQEVKTELLGTLKNMGKQEKANKDNINLLFKTVEKQQRDGIIDYKLIKSKNFIIKELKNKIEGINKVPHYILPKNIRISSSQKELRSNKYMM